MPLLEVTDLDVRFYTEDGVVRAVNDLSFSIERGETYGIVGESGTGKSVTARSLMNLIESPGRIENGAVRFRGENLLELSDEEISSIRGNRISMVFQDAQTALNPVYTVGEQIAETVRKHLGLDNAAARERTIEILEQVGIPDPETRYSNYPHQFSGGMQQRAVIAMALCCNPDLLICDEPTTALDVTIEAQILELLDTVADEFETSILMITHDLGVIAETCDRVMVMYAGEAVETAPVEELYYDAKHPYTVGLMSSIPRIGDDREQLQTIPGTMPDLRQFPPGCNFHPRCPFAEVSCTETDPDLVPVDGTHDGTGGGEHRAACLAYEDGWDGELTYSIVDTEADVASSPGGGPADE